MSKRVRLHSRTSNSHVNNLISPKFELHVIREFIAVLIVCKFDAGPLQIKVAIDRAGAITVLASDSDVNNLISPKVELIRNSLSDDTKNRGPVSV